ncbi:MAG TPA: bifunctional diaminohydroxyphosphoribosylaminopyrimidine deaminase/5-amino-6-(5-phosphoribosylamino)uracil reductase RibD [Planctomycetota bacterium]|nr:bifunctional diaminohydroxyphosphoribosylaminopyrimidine deaminase/5-amino-6-(5-phosphoribosylamino)uracil reductase RibD [Planctomycetota bacterium]
MDTLMSPAASLLDEAALRQILAELGSSARAFRFEVAPNPCVGAAVLGLGGVVARGYHRVYGGAHAEVEALEAAAKTDVPTSEWDTLVITLEPCSSTGKTPPCTDAILRSGIRRVVVGALDPDPRHRGRGLQLLRDAGLEVEHLEGATPLTEVAPYFLDWLAPERISRPRPWIIAKWAQTRSGQLSPPENHPGGRWISGQAARDEVQLLRSHVDAIVTGIGTVLADDPRLSVRAPGGTSRPPIRVVLDSDLRTPPDARLFQPAREGETAGDLHILCRAGASAVRHRALEEAGAQVWGLHATDMEHLRLFDVADWLCQRGVHRVLLECGPQLLEQCFEAGGVDQVRVITGSVNGGRGESMANRVSRLRFSERLDRECGEDSVLEAMVARARG